MKDPPAGSFTTGESSAAFKGVDELGQPLSPRCDTIGQQIHPLEDAATELRHSNGLLPTLQQFRSFHIRDFGFLGL